MNRLMDYLESRVERVTESGCWLWTGCLSINGYAKNHAGYVHREVLAATLGRPLGPWPNECACHKCDTRSCVNPNHLFLASQAENLKDMVAKGRQGRGIKARTAKLNDANIPIIRDLAARGVTQKAIADLFGVTHSNISRILRGQTWRHIPLVVDDKEQG